ncbi:MAG: hypothetical protein FJ279_07610, partial [Planctomycetes bacterium]|nr:hypothetical protein [Planctomycetota bacterium]
MKELISASFAQGGIPEGWLSQPVKPAFERGGLRSGRVTQLTIPLPAVAWGRLRVELQVEPIGGATLEANDRVLHVVVALTDEYPRHRALKYLHELGVGRKRVAPRPGVRSVAFEFDHGRLRGFADGEEVVSATGPVPQRFFGDLHLGLWDDCLVRHIRVLGDDAITAPPYPAPARARKDFFLEVNVDFFDDLIRAPFTRPMFDDLFAEFESWGVRRCHWIYYGGRKNGWWDFAPLGVAENWAKTVQNVGEILPTAVQAAHAHGIQLIGMMKPFDMGFQRSFGEGTPEARRMGRAMRIGGPVGWIASFVAEHPELLSARKTGTHGPAENEVFTRIDLVKEDDAPCAFKASDIRLYVSDDNARYQPYEGPMEAEEVVEDYPVYVHAAPGAQRTAATRRSRVMRLSFLQIRSKYLVLAVPSRKRSFTNTFVNLVRVFGEKGEERRVTYATEPRSGPAGTKQGFLEGGLEFDHYGGTPTAVFAGFDVVASSFALDG